MEIERLEQTLMKKIERHNEELKHLTALLIMVTKVKEAGQGLDEGAFSDDDSSDDGSGSDTSDACSLRSCDIKSVH